MGFGSQVGVADLHDDGRVELRLVDAGPPRPWTGLGAAAQAALEAEVVGRVEEPLVDATLARAIADGVLRTDDRLDRVYVGPGDLWNQPARDGVHAFLGAGDVTLAQVLRLRPFCGARSAWGGQLVATELPPAAAERLVGARPRRRSDPPCRRDARAVGLLRGPGRPAARHEHDWRPIAATLRDGLLAAVAR